MAETYKIIGGVPLKGEVTPIPNKNAMLACLPACILTDEDVIYKNLPQTTDVEKTLELLRRLGANVKINGSDTVINCKNIKVHTVDKEIGDSMRASIMFAGPLLARFGKAKIPLPGGCVLGKRSINAHIDALAKVGVLVEVTNGWANFKVPIKKPKNSFVWTMEASVTATENFAMYCAGTSAKYEIFNAASEPHVTQLLELLQSMGAKITGAGSNMILIEGNSKLGGATFIPEPDFVDVVGLISATGITHGKIKIKGVNDKHKLGGIFQTFEKFNIKIIESGKDVIVDGRNEIKIDLTESGFPLAGDDLPKFTPQPWPGFPVDGLPAVVALLCKLRGKVLVINWMYETGLDYIRELNAMGANIFMADPQRVIISGPCNFTGGKISSPQIIQACKALFIAALADNVETILQNADILKRRYPNVVSVYKSLGANIEVM